MDDISVLQKHLFQIPGKNRFAGIPEKPAANLAGICDLPKSA